MPEVFGTAAGDGQVAHRGQLLYFPSEPEAAPVWHEDGLLLVRDGRIEWSGDFNQGRHRLTPQVQVRDWHGALICPGLIDTHLHYPQTDVIASPAPDLLAWLSEYTYPHEARFEDPDHAAAVARFFLDELLRCGTTTALVYCTIHAAATEAFFSASHARNLRMIAGKVLMDRHCPPALRDASPETGTRSSEALLTRWHGTGRQLYALTPRFALTSSPTQLALCGELARSHPEVFIQTHLAETREEVRLALARHPGTRSYLDIYARYGLVRDRTVLGHSIWIDDDDRSRLREHGAAIAHCPTSNLFLGSGLFDLGVALRQGVRTTLGTDVGGGTSFSLLRTMGEAYKVARLSGQHVTALQLFRMVTQDAAQALGLAGQVGTLQAGAEADFIVLDPEATPLLARRCAQAASLEAYLFAFALLGDDRCVAATHVAGQRQYPRPAA